MPQPKREEITPIELTKYPIWELQPGEEEDWYDVFYQCYLIGQVPVRSQLRAAQLYEDRAAKLEKRKPKKRIGIPAALREKFIKYRWDMRANAFDRYQRQKQYEYFQEIYRSFLEQALSLAHKAFFKANEILDTPFFHEEVVVRHESGVAQVIHRQPLRNVGLKDAGILLDRGVELFKYAARIDLHDTDYAIEFLEKQGYKIILPWQNGLEADEDEDEEEDLNEESPSTSPQAENITTNQKEH